MQMEQSSRGNKNQLKTRQSMIGRLLFDQTDKIINDNKKLLADPKCNLIDAYLAFYNKLFNQMEQSYIKLYEAEINLHKISPQGALRGLVSHFKEASHYIWMEMVKQKQFQKIHARENQEIKNQMICKKCERHIISRNIEMEKIKIHTGQFFDPYNFYDEGLMEFQDEIGKMSIQKEIEIVNNQKQIYSHIFSLKERITKRTLQITQMINQLVRYTDENLKLDLLQPKNKKDEKTSTFESCFKNMIDIIQQKLIQAIRKIKIKRELDSESRKHVGFQIGQTSFEYERLINEKQSIKKTLQQKQRELNNLRNQIQTLQQNISKYVVEFEMNKFKNIQIEKQTHNLRQQLEGERQRYRRMSRRLSQKQKQVQKLTYEIRIIKIQFKKEKEELETQNKKILKGPLNNHKSLSKFRNGRHYSHTQSINDNKYIEILTQALTQNEVPENINGNAELKENGVNINEELNIHQKKHRLSRRQSRQNHQQSLENQDEKDSQISKMMQKRKQKKKATNLLKKEKETEVSPSTSERSIVSFQQRNKLYENLSKNDQIKTNSQLEKWQTEVSSKELDEIKSQLPQEQQSEVDEDQNAQKQNLVDQQSVEQSNFKLDIIPRYSHIKQQMAKNFQTEQTFRLHSNQKYQSPLIRKSSKLKMQRISVPVLESKFKAMMRQEMYENTVSIQMTKQSNDNSHYTANNSKSKQFEDRKDTHKSIENCRSFYRISKQNIGDKSQWDNGNDGTNMNRTLKEVAVENKVLQSFLSQKSAQKFAWTLPSTLSLKKQLETEENQKEIPQLFGIQDVKNLYHNVQGAIQYQKAKKIKYKQINILLKSNQLKFINKMLAIVASIHTYNASYYESIRGLLLYPYQYIVSQQNYLFIKKSGYNEIRIKEALIKILNIHRNCRNDGKNCGHLNRFMKRLENLFGLGKENKPKNQGEKMSEIKEEMESV